VCGKAWAGTAPAAINITMNHKLTRRFMFPFPEPFLSPV
jgi:hypothetical protein